MEGMAAAKATPQTAGGVTPAEFQALRADLYSQFTSLKESVSGDGPVSIGRLSFDSPQSCMDALQKWGASSPLFHHILDPVSIISLIQGPTKRREDYMGEAVLEQKTEKSSQMISVAASFESVIPDIFAGSKTAAGSVSHRSSMAGVKTFQLWDRGDNMSGVKNWLLEGVVHLDRNLAQQVDSLFSSFHPDLRFFLDSVRTESITLLKELCEEVSSLFRHMLYLSFGEKRYTEAEEKEVWEYALVFLEVYFSEMFKHRSKAGQIASYKDPLVANGLAMWASLQCISEHRVFKENRYRDDPRIYPKLQQHITKSYVRKNEITGVHTLTRHLRDDVSDLQADQKEVHEVLKRLEAKLGRVQQQCGGGGGDDDAGAGAVKLGKNAKKRKEKRAQAGTDE